MSPVRAVLSKNPAPEKCSTDLPQYGVLEDNDVASCYNINAGKQVFVFRYNQPATTDQSDETDTWRSTYNSSPLAITCLHVITRNMDCRQPFHVSVYVSSRPEQECRKKPVQCRLDISSKKKNGVTSCGYICDCSWGQCLADGLWYLLAAHPRQGQLCEVAIFPKP